MKKRTPIWLKFFMVSLVLLLGSAMAMLTIYSLYITEREQKLTDDTVLNSIHYTETNIDNFFNSYNELVGNMNLAEYIYDARKNNDNDYQKAIRQKMTSIYSDSSNFIAVFFRDSDSNCFSIGEAFMDLRSQVEMIDEFISRDEYKSANVIWCYKYIGRGCNSIVLCKDLIYVDNDYGQHKLGQMLVYLDADKISETFLGNERFSNVVVTDKYGNIVLSSESEIIGKKYEDIFDSDGKHIIRNGVKAYYRKKRIDISGWEITSYIETGSIIYVLRSTMIKFIGAVMICMFFISIALYMMSKRVNKPIEDLESYVREASTEFLANPHSGTGDLSGVQQAFESLYDDLKKEIKSNYKMQLMLKDATIKAYEHQINPHFLFNTLNMISMMNVMEKKEDVSKAITCLGDLLRFNLDKRSQVTFREEVENAKNYLKIIELRYKTAFRYSISFPEELMDCYTIKFIIQPLVENAVKHGFKKKKIECEMAIIGQVIENDLVIIIQDNGQGIERERLIELKAKISNDSANADGIGLVNVNERIRMIYGAEYGIDIFSEHGKYTQLLIHMPVCKTVCERGEQNV